MDTLGHDPHLGLSSLLPVSVMALPLDKKNAFSSDLIHHIVGGSVYCRYVASVI